MIDAGMVLQMVRAGQIPPQWQVLRAKAGFFIGQVVLGSGLAVGAVAAAVYILLSGYVFGYGLNDSTPEGVLTFWLAVDMLVLAALLVLGMVIVIQQIMRLGSIDENVLVLMPEGFVMRRGSKPKDTYTCSYQNIRAISRVVRNGSTYLMMRTADGRASRFSLDGRFGSPKKLAAQIENQQVNYRAALARAGRLHQ